jgi:hypothetical protein
MCFSKSRALCLPLAGLLALVLCSPTFAGRKGPAAYAPDQKMVVHEWGTFSTFSGSNGVNLKFAPYDNDLPEFVHGYLPRFSKQGPLGGTISLETPVLYFYSDKAQIASVQVEFPKGTMTEWYPQAARTTTKLVWKPIKILPREAKIELATEKKASRYYAARETDASLLAVAAKKDNVPKAETEKFLFYRGVGSFDMPLSVRAVSDSKLVVSWKGTGPEGDMILVRVRGGKLRFTPFQLEQRSTGSLQAEVQVPETDATEEELAKALVERLRCRGLYEKEARAMVKTWRSAWFGEDGTRVLYLLPDAWTESLLPMRLTPKPASVVRVLVGRHDVLTPEREKKVDSWVTTVNRPNGYNDAEGRAAQKQLAELGRYYGAACRAADARLKARK